MKRRKFLGITPLLATSIPMLLQSCKQEPKVVADAAAAGVSASTPFSLNQFGLQLWSVRDDMAKDPKGTIKALSEYGYSLLESFQHDKLGVFWGMKAKEYKDYLTSLNLDMKSFHCNPEYARDAKLVDEFKKLADDAASIGVKHMINPYVGFLKTVDEFKGISDGFNKCGEICKERGMKYGYHNHHYSFQKVGDVFPQDIMMNGTDPNLVDYEMDIYWVAAAKQDPIEWLKKYPNRFKLSHVKDRAKPEVIAEYEKKEKPNPDFGVDASCVLGTGQLDFSKILEVAKANGMETYIVEQERWENSTPMADAKSDADYMKKFVKS
jgi:sugar phosphate isomerase/epimerase